MVVHHACREQSHGFGGWRRSYSGEAKTSSPAKALGTGAHAGAGTNPDRPGFARRDGGQAVPGFLFEWTRAPRQAPANRIAGTNHLDFRYIAGSASFTG